MAERGLDRTEKEIQKPDIVGSCPGVEVAGVKVPCILNTSSQVTLFGELFIQKWLGHIKPRGAKGLNWLTLKVANGLSIPYMGYAILDFAVAVVMVPGKDVVIVGVDKAGNARDHRLLERSFQEGHSGPTSFNRNSTSH